MSILNLFRRGHNKAVKVLKPYPERYTATLYIKILGTTIAKYDLDLNAKNRTHALELAKAWARRSMGLEWKIKPKKRNR
jgi:hypothetical protein